jgi:ribosomal protein S18 acetylase RimI-like enzyme
VKSGKVIHRFTAKDGRDVILRMPRWEDLDDLLACINSLVEEGAEILQTKKFTRDEEADWLGRLLADIEKDTLFCVVAEVDGKAMANSSLQKKKGYSSHVGVVDIGIRKGFRDIGIGTEMTKRLISHARSIGLKLLTLCVFSSNKKAIHVYEKLGFTETGRIPNGLYKDGRYLDEILMVKEL